MKKEIHKKLSIREIIQSKRKINNKYLSMLTCYDFQSAQLLNETALDLILVGDSLGNVILGYENTISVSLNEMTTFASAVKRGAKNKFVVCDLPFGSISPIDEGIRHAKELYQQTQVEALKIEGASVIQLNFIESMVNIGIPIMGHIGLIPQFINQLGGFYKHGKTKFERDKLLEDALNLQKRGVFSLVLECVDSETAALITQELKIPTIGIGSGVDVDGQVLVINDLLRMSNDKVPSFVNPIANFYELKKSLIDKYLEEF